MYALRHQAGIHIHIQIDRPYIPALHQRQLISFAEQGLYDPELVFQLMGYWMSPTIPLLRSMSA